MACGVAISGALSGAAFKDMRSLLLVHQNHSSELLTHGAQVFACDACEFKHGHLGFAEHG
jgi:hypothetical protein